MSSNDDTDVPITPPQDTGLPDQVERDPAALNSAEDLDEDRLRLDPLEEGLDPPERWSEAQRYGTTDYEQSHRESLEQRLAEEEPEVTAPPEPPDETSGADELDEPVDSAASVEDVADVTDVDPSLLDVPPERANDEAIRRGQAADEGGSVAEAARTPDEPE
ncbi:hypothetical protein [Goodfellowiella coeruleoviolacea]|uniref:DUF5709 domain-containing protein n=1 Tax=Goodfellowiella coeruleoviolacea TaxID=334858 RepID=A0AAE3G8Q0_9PSEU|nr:hypothetical protein [Goodfellowiella coeruleoviolacea]MCP2163727.1 hypothetical protein [Goodfellowiella coeruleoviolacea]